MCGWALSWRKIGPFLLIIASFRHCSFWCVSLICWALLLRCNGFARIQKAAVNQTRSRPPNSDHDLFGCKFGFGKCFGASSWSNYWGGHHQLSYKIHFSLHVTTKWRHVLLLLHRIIEDDTSKWQFLKFWSADEAPIYWAFSPFKFASNEFFKFLCSCKRINFDYSSQFIVVNFVTGHCAFHHQGTHLLCKASWTTTALYIY